MKHKLPIALAIISVSVSVSLMSAKAQPEPEREYGSLQRHQLALVWGVPEPYRSMSNPPPFSAQTIRQGAAVYGQHCASCHGDGGVGDGLAGKDLILTPGNLAWLSRMPMAQWDGFLYWTVAEGGARFGTAMPAYKDTLSKEEIWAVISYIQERLPKNPE